MPVNVFSGVAVIGKHPFFPAFFIRRIIITQLFARTIRNSGKKIFIEQRTHGGMGNDVEPPRTKGSPM
jgi:hypothetical protein